MMTRRVNNEADHVRNRRGYSRSKPSRRHRLRGHVHDRWMTEAVAQSKLTEAGYTVKSIKTTRAGNCFEAYAADKDGKRVELFLDPTTGNIVHTQ